MKNWIQEDVKTQDDKMEYAREKFVDKKFLDGLVKDATTIDAKNTILKNYNLQWDETNNNFVALDGYKRIDMYGSNYAVETTSAVVTAIIPPKESSTADTSKVDTIATTTILTLSEVYKVAIKKESETSYVVENGTESIHISYDPQDIDSPYSIGIFSFKDADSAVYVAEEINTIMTKVKNNQLSLRHFELSTGDKYLQADYRTRIFDF